MLFLKILLVVLLSSLFLGNVFVMGAHVFFGNLVTLSGVFMTLNFLAVPIMMGYSMHLFVKDDQELND